MPPSAAVRHIVSGTVLFDGGRLRKKAMICCAVPASIPLFDHTGIGGHSVSPAGSSPWSTAFSTSWFLQQPMPAGELVRFGG
jgi:hypothetical protein